MTANKKLKMGAEKVDPDVFSNFSFVMVDKEHDKDAPFTRSLLRTCVVVNINEILLDSDIESIGELPTLRDNMKKPPLLAERTDSTRNRALVAVVCMGMLCYAQNERSNIIQRIGGHFAFASNVGKRFVKAFHQMGILVSY